MVMLAILSFFGIILSVINNVTPTYAVHLRIKSGELSQISQRFLRLNHLCQVCWLIYSVSIMSPSLIVVNTITSFLSCVSLFLYEMYTGNFFVFLRKYCCSFIFITTLMLNFINFHVQGLICVTISICATISTAENLRNAVKMSNYKCIDVNMAVSGTISSINWFFFGILSKDINIIGSNLIGVLLGVALVSTHYYLKYAQSVLPRKDIISP